MYIYTDENWEEFDMLERLTLNLSDKYWFEVAEKMALFILEIKSDITYIASSQKRVIYFYDCMRTNKHYSEFLWEWCYNMTFKFLNVAIKIPKIELFYVEDYEKIMDVCPDNFENVYGLFWEYDLANWDYWTVDIDSDIESFVVNNLMVLPNHTDLEFMFGIYDLWEPANIVELDGKKHIVWDWENKAFFEYVINETESDWYDMLDYKDCHVLLVNWKYQYCDNDCNTIQWLCRLYQDYIS